MYAPLPPEYRRPDHLLHLVLLVPTLGISWVVAYYRCRRHNDRELQRWRGELAQAGAVADAKTHAHLGWLYQQFGWLAAEVRRVAPGPRPPFVVDANQVPPNRPRYQTPPAQRSPVTQPRPYAAPALHTPDAEPSGKHSTAVVQTRAIPQVPRKPQ